MSEGRPSESFSTQTYLFDDPSATVRTFLVEEAVAAAWLMFQLMRRSVKSASDAQDSRKDQAQREALWPGAATVDNVCDVVAVQGDL